MQETGVTLYFTAEDNRDTYTGHAQRKTHRGTTLLRKVEQHPEQGARSKDRDQRRVPQTETPREQDTTQEPLLLVIGAGDGVVCCGVARDEKRWMGVLAMEKRRGCV